MSLCYFKVPMRLSDDPRTVKEVVWTKPMGLAKRNLRPLHQGSHFRKWRLV